MVYRIYKQDKELENELNSQINKTDYSSKINLTESNKSNTDNINKTEDSKINLTNEIIATTKDSNTNKTENVITNDNLKIEVIPNKTKCMIKGYCPIHFCYHEV